MLKLELKSQNLNTTLRNVICVFYGGKYGGSIFPHFGPCTHILATGRIYVIYEHEKKRMINSFIHIEGILSGRNNVLTLYSGRILETKNDLVNKVQDKLNTENWKEFIQKRLSKIDAKTWMTEAYEVQNKS